MADLAQGPAGGEGTTAAAPDTGTTQAAPATDGGQATATTSQPTGQAGTGQAPEETYFDPTQVPAELQPAYKLMQSAFTRKMTELSERGRKYTTYEQFAPVIEQYQRDPVSVIQQLASQHGLQLTRAQAANIAAQQGAPAATPQEWQPNNWDEVLAKAEERAEQRLMAKLAPVIGNVQQMQAKNIEAQLDGIDPEWRTYEDAMKNNLQKYPQMVQDVATLYRISVPPEVIEARATQSALSRLQRKTSDARASGTSTVKAGPAPREIKSFDDAVAFAKEQLSRR